MEELHKTYTKNIEYEWDGAMSNCSIERFTVKRHDTPNINTLHLVTINKILDSEELEKKLYIYSNGGNFIKDLIMLQDQLMELTKKYKIYSVLSGLDLYGVLFFMPKQGDGENHNDAIYITHEVAEGEGLFHAILNETYGAVTPELTPEDFYRGYLNALEKHIQNSDFKYIDRIYLTYGFGNINIYLMGLSFGEENIYNNISTILSIMNILPKSFNINILKDNKKNIFLLKLASFLFDMDYSWEVIFKDYGVDLLSQDSEFFKEYQKSLNSFRTSTNSLIIFDEVSSIELIKTINKFVKPTLSEEVKRKLEGLNKIELYYFMAQLDSKEYSRTPENLLKTIEEVRVINSGGRSIKMDCYNKIVAKFGVFLGVKGHKLLYNLLFDSSIPMTVIEFFIKAMEKEDYSNTFENYKLFQDFTTINFTKNYNETICYHSNNWEKGAILEKLGETLPTPIILQILNRYSLIGVNYNREFSC